MKIVKIDRARDEHGWLMNYLTTPVVQAIPKTGSVAVLIQPATEAGAREPCCIISDVFAGQPGRQRFGFDNVVEKSMVSVKNLHKTGMLIRVVTFRAH